MKFEWGDDSATSDLQSQRQSVTIRADCEALERENQDEMGIEADQGALR